ncbi:hypothetical protein AB0758_43680 [Tolypothrix bouteillei VB521301_2]
MLAPLGILYQDVSKGLTLITGFWLFLTPVVYPVPNEGTFGLLVKLNPVTPLLVTARELATTGVISTHFKFWVNQCTLLCGIVLTWVTFSTCNAFCC